MVKRFIRTMRVYFKLPEMRLFWLFVVLGTSAFVLQSFYIEGQALAVFGTSLIFLAIVVFINNLRLAHSNLEVKLERNEMFSVIQNLRDGIIAYDVDFKVLIFNRAAESIFGVSRADVVGRIFSLEYTRELRAKTLAQAMYPSLAPLAVSRSNPGAAVQVIDITLTDPHIELRVASTKIIDPSGAVLGFLKIISDRTREVEALRSKSEFITIAAHNLRTPLNAVTWTMETVVKETGLSAEGKVFMENGLKAAGNLSKIVNDLLDVAKIEEGRFGYTFKELELVGLIEGILKEASLYAEKFGVKVFFEKPKEGVIMAFIDGEKLKLALHNLIDNAIKYNMQNGSVTVRVAKSVGDSSLTILIEDTGLGVPEGDVSKLFTKFFRAPNVIKVQTEGSGLGLYITKNIILRHGGKISVESVENRGTTFRIQIPLDRSRIPQREFVYDEESEFIANT